MKIIKDERLIIQNLRNIRIAFLFQTICILGILIYDGISKGITHVTDNPLWLVFMGTSVILGYLNLRISVDEYETHNKKKQGPYYKNVFISLVVGVIFSVITILTPEGTVRDAVIIGGVMFGCFLFSFTVVYYLRKKRYDEFDDEE
ncbi:branched-chain amino acid ABC transporter substrate-binding protein [Neobacillus rhizophilus]|uniref:Branched-chain amino acid ABC transporter substrate-binding protein n=1 Tax=Neobacillus rhizophilus TaxID=2833579 RepID=A0A942U719_9BACI|nr:branched-chain amino acid ABC transporter substrate-binding protein [Neobacillus rhizophilus]MBS4214117.1 branched-chain amino acid ABC transporter substrate-binding protein [Neobacillus rhizophilus]